jgi:transcription initiation factor TFIIIB Brf1 subunit/transcription initiation factor TFIIB
MEAPEEVSSEYREAESCQQTLFETRFLHDAIAKLALPETVTDMVKDLMLRRARMVCCKDRRLSICACIAMSSQELNCPRVYKEIAAATGMAWRSIVVERRRVDKADRSRPVTLTIRARDLVARNAQRLDGGKQSRRALVQTKRLCDAVEGLAISQGRSAATVSAASYYILQYGLDITVKQIDVERVAVSSGIAATTVRKLLNAIKVDREARDYIEQTSGIKT